jgi:hypothetical protein
LQVGIVERHIELMEVGEIRFYAGIAREIGGDLNDFPV